ncbi:Os11g0577800, partial [Oryza sativa Japonica Group]
STFLSEQKKKKSCGCCVPIHSLDPYSALLRRVGRSVDRIASFLSVLKFLGSDRYVGDGGGDGVALRGGGRSGDHGGGGGGGWARGELGHNGDAPAAAQGDGAAAQGQRVQEGEDLRRRRDDHVGARRHRHRGDDRRPQRHARRRRRLRPRQGVGEGERHEVQLRRRRRHQVRRRRQRAVPQGVQRPVRPRHRAGAEEHPARADVAGTMADMVRFLNRSGAPLTVNIYPFLSLYGNDDFPLDYAFFDGGPPPRPVVDNGINYTNVFDANFDTLVSALKRIGFGSLPIVIGEVGWPTDGDKHATVPYAQRFYSGLLKRLAARRGTPLRPRARIEVYLFGLMDEDTKSVAPGNFERHWGIFTFDGRPKFPLDLRGAGRPAMPVPAKGVKYLPRRWCVLNPNVTDDDAGRLADNVGYACSHSDCTALGYGCSCGALDARGNASYAFNVYYQAQGQADAACDFQGLAVVTEDDRDVAQGACNFSVQVAAAALVGAAVAAAAAVACAAAVVAALLALV